MGSPKKGNNWDKAPGVGARYSGTITELPNRTSHADRNTEVGGGIGTGEKKHKTLTENVRKTGKVG